MENMHADVRVTSIQVAQIAKPLVHLLSIFFHDNDPRVLLINMGPEMKMESSINFWCLHCMWQKMMASSKFFVCPFINDETLNSHLT